jgi:hypothetical protein
MSSAEHGLPSVFRTIHDDNGKSSGFPRGVPLVTRMQELQASRRGNQWHPRSLTSVEKRAPYPLPPKGLTLTRQNTG